MSSASPSHTPKNGWRKSSFSESGGQCVEVKAVGAQVQIRDSKYLRDPSNDPAAQPIITVPAHSWPAVLADVVHGSAASGLTILTAADGGAMLRSGSVELAYTAGEWAAFVAGVKAGEFTLAVPVAA
jgi:hypothetical protein